MISAPGNIVVVERSLGAMEADVFENRIQLVKHFIDNGRIGGGSYGSSAHVVALDHLEAHIANVRKKIAKHHEVIAEGGNNAES